MRSLRSFFQIKIVAIRSSKEIISSDHSIHKFRSDYFQPKIPVKLTGYGCDEVPAIQRWFSTIEGDDSGQQPMKLNSAYFQKLDKLDFPVLMEKTSPANGPKVSSVIYPQPAAAGFERFEAPFSLFLSWADHTLSGQAEPANGAMTGSRLYIAQHAIDSLPGQLQDDLPTPELVRNSGKGDVYASSIWMGIPPTHTPLHKDPNPNLFIQMAGQKVIRMVQPQAGSAILSAARAVTNSADVWAQAGGTGGIRGEEMMGVEGQLTDEIIWDSSTVVEEGSAAKQDSDTSRLIDVVEAKLNPGDAVFIPQGWWHSVKGHGDGINASVNWWFR